MPPNRCVRIALLGVGKIGRELINRTINEPCYRYVAVGDSSGVMVNAGGFSGEEMASLAKGKERGISLRDCESRHDFNENMANVLTSCKFDVLVDVTATQTYELLMEALEYAHLVVANKIPIADVSQDKFQRLMSKVKSECKVLDIGTTVGAGMRIPDLISTLGVNGLEHVSGCLSGTMNYVSQRLNEGSSLSTAIREAMTSPRWYTEPDPRVDLGGEDFARKLVIIGRLCGRKVERSAVSIENIVRDELRTISPDEFLKMLPSLDLEIQTKVEKARGRRNALWYLGTADLLKNEYRIRFEEVPRDDPVTRCREHDNILKILPKSWRRPVTLIGPGAGVPETVTGLISGLSFVRRAISASFDLTPDPLLLQ